MTPSTNTVVVRHELHPGDLGALVALHGTMYAQEYGFDVTFEAYVAGPLAQFVCAQSERDRLWLAERSGRLIGAIAIVGTSAREAQLRWYLVAPLERGWGLGTRLLNEALQFCRQCGYEKVFLWTIRALTAAARRYRTAGFVLVEEKATSQWGVDVIEEKYELDLTALQ